MNPLVKESNVFCTCAEIFHVLDKKDAVFLDSSLQNDYGRYSIIGLHSYHCIQNDYGKVTINGRKTDENFESYLDNYLRKNKIQNPTNLPIIGGAIGYFTYDYGREKEVGTRHEDEEKLPYSILNFYDNFIIEDHKEHKLYLTACGQLKDACDSILELENLVKSVIQNPPDLSYKKTEYPVEVTANFEKQEYMDTVERMRQYIIEGDIYIANMTQKLTIKSDKDPYEAFLKSRAINPAPFGGYFDYGDFQIVCASPERFLFVNDGKVETRPIKGTRKRGETPKEDAALKQELKDSGKDQSELLMIVDLERNDLNHVCETGSVKVTELFEVETYATVFHLVSTVTGFLPINKTFVDLLLSTFPGGSITGAPKIRAMQIIDKLEHSSRNLYTGSIGYIGLDGNCDLNIVIRTAVHKDGKYYLGVGGGITYESELEFEYEETLQKAKAVVEALR
ncbi:Para-aminobenzoate synthase, aminase component [Lachnospiraceae bacterium TWA4]|nr:Para-aminobenzoate synthase, aminase component [Lachnospiraceae bacterium TWA4]